MVMYDAAFSNRSNQSLRLIVNQGSQSIAGNYTNVDWRLELYRMSGVGSWSNDGGGSYNININGSNYSGTVPPFNLQSNSWILIRSGTTRVYHNADGTKTFSFYANASGVPVLGNASHPSRSMTLTRIPRASSISSVTSSVAAGSTATVNISRASSSFTHRVVWSFGSSFSYTQTGVGTSASYTIPMNWLNGIPNSTSGTATVRVYTYSGSTLLGETSRSFTITAPASVGPSISGLLIDRIDNDVPPEWDIYVDGRSSVRIRTQGAVSQYGATIRSYSVTLGGARIGSSADVTYGPISGGAGSYGITVTVTDSRGRTASLSSSISVLGYLPPAITRVNLVRCLSDGTEDYTEGTYAKLTVDYSFSEIGLNSTTTEVSYYRDGGWVSLGSFDDGVPIVLGDGSFNVDNSYNFLISVSDEFDSVEQHVSLGTAFVTMDFLAGGKGVAFGKVAQFANALDVNFGIFARKDFVSLQLPYFVDGAAVTTGSDYSRELIEDQYFLPNQDQPLVDLHSDGVTFNNTDRSHFEQFFYSSKDFPTSSQPVLHAQAPSGWYPIAGGKMPYAILYGNAQSMTAGKNYSGWVPFGSSIAAPGGMSYRTHDEIFSIEIDGQVLKTQLAGHYRATILMQVQIGTGTMAGSFSSLGIPNRALEHGHPLNSSQRTYIHLTQDLILPVGGYIYYRVNSGSLSIGGGGTYMKLEYLGPAYKGMAP